MINWHAVTPQIQALAGHEALRQAQIGTIPWTGALAREHNRRWLKDTVPNWLTKRPDLAEEGRCECGGVCLVVAADEQGLYHRCQACQTIYRVMLEDYGHRWGSENND